MGELHNVWRHYVKDGVPQVLNFFAIGDAAVRTNPLYGRGCSSGVVEAHLLRGALDASDDPVERAQRSTSARSTKAIDPRPTTPLLVVQLDLNAIRRAEHETQSQLSAGTAGADHERASPRTA